MKPGHIEFRREVIPARVLRRGGTGGLEEVSLPLEFRTDPLTGRTCHIVPFSLERIIRPDLEALVQRSRELTCPFCPPLVEKITPRFPPELVPEGDIRFGRAFGFPNISPYDVYGAVVVVSEEHYIPLDGFTVPVVRDALLAAQQHLRAVARADPAARYRFIAWNYMPAAGGSLVHPHLQSNAGYFPTDFEKPLLEAAAAYFKDRGTDYWSDLVAAEQRAGERYIGRTGGVEWLTAFAPRGRLSDVLAVFPDRPSVIDLTKDDLEDFAAGLLKVFAFIDGLNLAGFNMATYSGFDGSFRAHARITPRGSLLYSPIETSDQFYYQVLHDENICILPPEVAAADLRQSLWRTDFRL
jgi:UDPglucose--hexose-1-phosphate uridylyltransferase